MKHLTYKDKSIDRITPLYHYVEVTGYEHLFHLKKDAKVQLTDDEHFWVDYVQEVKKIVEQVMDAEEGKKMSEPTVAGLSL
jgi:hypothetical protein